MIRADLQEKIEKSYEVLRLARDISLKYYDKPLIVTDSGGKDSLVLSHLALQCLKPDEFELVNSHTTVDAPETVYFLREKFAEYRKLGVKCTVQYSYYEDGSPITMWNMIEKMMFPPTRLLRYCCHYLKETTTPNRIVANGIRKAESSMRKDRHDFTIRSVDKEGRKELDLDYLKDRISDSERITSELGGQHNDVNAYDCVYVVAAKENKDLMCNPILEWTDKDVWEYIRENKLKYNPLYDVGWKRVGCVGCSMARSEQRRGFAEYPKYKEAYIRAFDRMLERRREKGLPIREEWTDGEGVFRWWTQERERECVGQTTLEDFFNDPM